MTSFRYRFETQGERLYGFVRDWMTGELPRGLRSGLSAGMSRQWIEYFRQLAAVALCVGGSWPRGVHLERYKADQDLYHRQYRSYLNDYLLISKGDLDDLLDAALPAVRAGRGARFRTGFQEGPALTELPTTIVTACATHGHGVRRQ